MFVGDVHPNGPCLTDRSWREAAVNSGDLDFFNEEIDDIPGLHRMRSMDITTEALDCLLAGRMADVAVARDWELLREIARLAEDGPPVGLASSDPKLFERWRAAVTDFHLKGWSQMTPQRVDDVVARHGIQIG
jgi:hypothetical protein